MVRRELFYRAFQVSSDVWLKPEFWADSIKPDDIEEHESFILDNKVFTIEPQKGVLNTGEFCFVTIIYRYVMMITWNGVS